MIDCHPEPPSIYITRIDRNRFDNMKPLTAR